MKLRFKVDQAACFRKGINCESSIVTIDVNPSKLPQRERDLIADRLIGINVCKLNAKAPSDDNESHDYIVAENLGYAGLLAAVEKEQLEIESNPKRRGRNEITTLWKNLVESIGKASPFIRGFFFSAHPVSLSGNVLTIGFPTEHADQIKLVSHGKNHALLSAKLSELGYPDLTVRFVVHDSSEQEGTL